MSKITYQDAGVNVAEGQRTVELMKEAVARTFTPGVLTGIGSFGALFQPDLTGMTEPVLVSGTDGVGTKLKLAFLMDRHDTIGRDCVAMCVNDILCHGAQPLFFLDYLATGRLQGEKAAAIVAGVAAGCQEAGCALVGGETAEMPGFYPEGEYDLAGFAVGLADRKKLVTGENIQPGDLLIGLASSGIHSNGFSLVRRLLLEEKAYSLDAVLPELAKPLGEVLLTPTRIYVKPVLSVMKHHHLKGMAHITGGGFHENIPRMLPAGCQATIHRGSWPVPPVFKLLAEAGNLEEEDLYTTFNMGIGLVIAVAEKEAEQLRRSLVEQGEQAWIIGEVTAGEKQVTLCNP
ncbi:phosphoribosylformylglycinamidine cyclo-ligase [Anoxynatronum buryatiense]|uniref:Phosphoribosylformylglycinamidine cyclo-ligase n=1 Tax=Anoxynatronum buryatiense TaxID=489973 RepID=A0AA45WWM8_9CLOT|nr:phosphoribosylformylglycinamidine cyclo-ligase [Anoxynatronum buryatiense]SMP59927.1 phosphoribosylformylglycinamidine cyclo-ligase [Anoxynatronum buryatiense]